MTDLTAAEIVVRQFDARNAEREHDGLPPYQEPSPVSFARALLKTTTERDRLAADRERLLAACKAVHEWFGSNSPEDESVLDQVEKAIENAEQK